MDNGKNNNGLGFDGNGYDYYRQITENQNAGYPDDINPIESPVFPEPTKEEQGLYDNSRLEATGIAIDTAAEDARRQRVKSITESLPKVQSNPVNEDGYYFGKQNTSIDETIRGLGTYSVVRREKVVVSDKVVEPEKRSELKSRAKDIAKTLAKILGTVALAALLAKGAHSFITQPDPVVPEKSPSDIELEEKINNAENMNEVIDIINEHKAEQQNVVQYPDNNYGYDDVSQGGRSL